jgi:hypothetical protein
MGNMSAGQGGLPSMPSYLNPDGTVNWANIGGSVLGAGAGIISANNPQGTTTAPPSWLASQFQNTFGAANQFYNSANPVYTGQLTASLSPEEQAGITGAKSLANGVSPADVSSWLNPYTSSVIDTTNSNLNRQRDLELGQVNDQAQAAGAYGGDRQAVADSLTNYNADQVLAQTDASLNQANFQNAESEANANQGLKVQGNQNEIAAGQLQTNQSQLGLSNTYAAWQAQQAQRIANLNALYGSTASTAALRSSGTTSTKGSPVTAGILGGGTSSPIAGIGSAIFSKVLGSGGNGGGAPASNPYTLPANFGQVNTNLPTSFSFNNVPGMNSAYASTPIPGTTFDPNTSNNYFGGDGSYQDYTGG